MAFVAVVAVPLLLLLFCLDAAAALLVPEDLMVLELERIRIDVAVFVAAKTAFVAFEYAALVAVTLVTFCNFSCCNFSCCKFSFLQL